MKTTLLILTLNEIDGLEIIMPRIDPNWVDQILFVDGNSTDGTIEWINRHEYELIIQKAPGIRRAYQDALESIKGDIVITFSPDGNSIPELIPNLITKISAGFDMVIVSRYLDGSKSFDDDLLSYLGNKFFTKSINFLYGSHYTDAMVIYRGYRTNLLKELEITNDRWYLLVEKIFGAKGLGCEPLISTRAARRKLRVGEIKGEEPGRISGTSRVFPNLFVKIRWAFAYYCQILADRFRWK